MLRSGQILDVYDDTSGSTFRELFPRFEEVPGSIKVAKHLDWEERQALPNDVFALVIHQGDQVFRKYACVDRGNTELALLYFLKHGHALPREIQEKAAQNLGVASSWYGIEPGQVKQAFAGAIANFGAKRLTGMATNAIKNPGATALKGLGVLGAVSQARESLGQANQGMRQSKMLGGAVVPPHEAKHMFGAH